MNETVQIKEIQMNETVQIRRAGMKRVLASVGAAALLMAAAGCSSPGATTDEPASSASSGGIALPVTADSVAELGAVTLNVWADGGEEDFMKTLVPRFEAAYPNVKVNLTLKGYNDLISTVVPAMNSDDAPDVAQGAQGYQVDGALVAADLIRPMDDVAEAYDWASTYNETDFGQFAWSDAGTFGSGTMYGMSPVAEYVGVFYNKKKLESLGLQVPATHDELTADLAAAKAAGEIPIMMGNSDKYPATHVFGLVQGAYTPAVDTRDWIGGKTDTTFNLPTNVTALDELKSWVDDGYFPEGYDGISGDDAAAEFGAGNGVFMMAGTWNAAALEKTLAGDVGFIANPAGSSGLSAGTGSLGLPWHISSKTDSEAAAIAFVSMVMAPESAQELTDVSRIPAANAPTNSSSSLFSDMVVAGQTVLGDGGLTYYFDWATVTMYDVFTAKMQEFLAGRISSADFIDAVQADWEASTGK